MNINIVKLTSLLFAGGFVLSSCEKEMNNYAPVKPIGGYTSAKQIATDNLVAYWAFDGGLKDSVANLLATQSNTSFISGKKGQALMGSANGQVVVGDAGTVIPNLKSYTISFWMNTQQATKATGVFSLNNNNDFWGNLDIYLESYVQNDIPNPDTLFFKVHMNNDNVKWKGQFTDTKIGAAVGKWVHIAVSYNANTSIYNIYQNGKQVGVNTAANPAKTLGPMLHGDDPSSTNVPYGPLKFVNATKLVFGAFQFQTNPSSTGAATAQDWATNYSGAMDEFRIYNKALDDADVNSLYKLESIGR